MMPTATPKSTRKFSGFAYLIFTFALAWAVFLLIELFRRHLYVVFSADTYLAIHIIAELTSIIVSISIFGFGWFTYRQSRNNYILFLGIAFLGIGILDFMHTMSFPGMPRLITASSTDKGIQFWLAARLFAAVAFLISAFIIPGEGKRALPRKTLLTFVIGLTAADFIWVNFYPHTLPVYFVPGVGLTTVKMVAEWAVIVIGVAAFAAYYVRVRKTDEQILVWFMCALILTIFGEFAFTLYKSAYDTFNLLGHVYKVAAIILIYRGVFIASASQTYTRLEQSEEEFSRAFLNSPTIMAITKPDTGEIIEVNEAFRDFFGYTQEELAGKTTLELDIWADVKQRDRMLDQLNKTGSAHDIEAALRTKSGKIRYAIDSADYIYLDNTKYLLSVAIDVTDRKQAEQNLLEIERELRNTISALKKDEEHIKELSDLRAKFIQIISHQLRTPLGSMRWTIRSLLDGNLGPLSKAQKQFLALTYDADVAVIDRVNDLLTTIDIEESRVHFEKAAVSMGSLLKSVVITMKHQAEDKHITLTYHPPKTELPPVFADAKRVRTAFEKLIDNAIVFTPEKGKVTITLSQVGSHIRFEVADTGIGIPKAEQEHIFTSFFRASNAFLAEPNATGVGLTIAKNFIERQGGTMGFSSVEGKGSSFWFELPVAPRREERALSKK